MRYFFSFLLLIALPIMADDLTMKPGLWEHKMKFESESGRLEQAFEQVRQQLAAAPPAQRQMIEQMLEQQGMNLDFTNQTFKSCLSEEDARKGDFQMSENEDCETTDVDESDGEKTLRFSCDASDYESEGSITFASDTQYSGEARATVEMDGQAEKMTVTHAGQWLGEDCGDLNP